MIRNGPTLHAIGVCRQFVVLNDMTSTSDRQSQKVPGTYRQENEETFLSLVLMTLFFFNFPNFD